MIVREVGSYDRCAALRATCAALRAAVDAAAERVGVAVYEPHPRLAAALRGLARRCPAARRLDLYVKHWSRLAAEDTAALVAERWARLEALALGPEAGLRPGAAAALAAAAGAGRLPRLRELYLRNSTVETASVAALFARPWTALEELTFGDGLDDGDAAAHAAAAPRALPALARLAVCGRATAAGTLALAAARWAAPLQSLDLRGCAVSAAGARALAASPALALRACSIGGRGIDADALQALAAAAAWPLETLALREVNLAGPEAGAALVALAARFPRLRST